MAVKYVYNYSSQSMHVLLLEANLESLGDTDLELVSTRDVYELQFWLNRLWLAYTT